MAQTIYVNPGDDLQKIFDAASENSIIHIAAGEYRQKVLISTPGLTITGEGADKTVIVYDDYSKRLDGDGLEYNTFRTYTVAVCADRVSMKGLSIVNDALHPEVKGQEVALSICGDEFVMEDCRLSSTQDTLFCGPLPPDLIERYDGFLDDRLRRGDWLNQRFTRCLIEGTVDFIFGCGEAFFRECEIRSLNDARGTGYAAAPAHSLWQKKGFHFYRCRFSCEESVTPGSIFLARPWRDYGLCVFELCTYARHIAREGFDKWSGTNRDKTARFIEDPPVNGRVPWANRTE